MKWIAI